MTAAGEWPRPLLRLLWDLTPARWAPPNDGASRPAVSVPDWIKDVPATAESVNAARRANDEAIAAARSAEEKAARLLQTGLVLLALAISLSAFQLRYSIAGSGLRWLAMGPATLSIIFLSIAAFESAQVDRVGFYSHPSSKDLEGVASGEVERALIACEEVGRQLALSTSRSKHTELMQARAWFSRGLVALISAAICAAILSAIDYGEVEPPTTRMTDSTQSIDRSASTEPVIRTSAFDAETPSDTAAPPATSTGVEPTPTTEVPALVSGQG